MRWCRRGHLRGRALSGSLANTALTFVPTVCSGTKMKTAIRVYSSRQIVAEKALNPVSLDSLCVPMELALAAPLAKFRQLWRVQGSDYRTLGRPAKALSVPGTRPRHRLQSLRLRRLKLVAKPERPRGLNPRGAPIRSSAREPRRVRAIYAYFSVLPISVNTVLTFPPTNVTAVMINTAIRLAISAYSIAVTPDSSLRKLRT